MRSLQLAWKYIKFHRGKTLTLIACITLTLFLPIALTILISQFNQEMVARARSTPFVVGAKGSKLDLIFHALYFNTEQQTLTTYGQVAEIEGDGLATAYPIHAGFTLRQVPIVGTSLDYFDFRRLRVGEGEMIARVGDCVLGHNVARKLELKIGDRPMSDSENVLDIAGAYPLRLTVVGIFEKTNSADDEAIFVDLKTAWVLEGKGHGHQDIAEVAEENLLSSEGNNKIASAAVQPYLEVDDENVTDFHFHGDRNEFPISAIIVRPKDEMSATFLLDRLGAEESAVQMVQPLDEVGKLMALVFKIQKFFNANAVLLGASTLLFLGLVIFLSLRLRKNEMETMFKLGCSRGTIAWMQISELALIFLFSMVILAFLSWLVYYFAPELVKWLLEIQ